MTVSYTHLDVYKRQVYHELAGYAACQAVEGTNAADGEVDGLLIAAGEAAVDVVGVVAGANGVSSGVDCFFELPVFGQPAESGEGGGMAVGFHLIIYGVGCVVAVDVYAVSYTHLGVLRRGGCEEMEM